MFSPLFPPRLYVSFVFLQFVLPFQSIWKLFGRSFVFFLWLLFIYGLTAVAVTVAELRKFISLHDTLCSRCLCFCFDVSAEADADAEL